MKNKVKELEHKCVQITIYDDGSFSLADLSGSGFGNIIIETVDVETTAKKLIDLIFSSTRMYVREELNKLL